jgi:glycerophosphoryl diester phosphodiesterase
MKLLFNSILTGLILCFIFSCKRDPALYEVNNLNGNKISAFGHGGMGIKFKFPIDCFESISECMRFGADGTEIDIQMTRDSVLVAFHNYDLSDATLCSGVINDQLWSSIWGCHFTSPLSSTLGLSSVDDILTELKKYDNATYTFDCKMHTSNNDILYKHRFANAIIRLMDSRNIRASNLYIESQDTTFLRILKTKRTELNLFIYPRNFHEGLSIAEHMDLFGITISNDDITKDQVKLAHEKGIRIALWNTKNQKENLNAILKSPDFIQSDDIMYLLKIFGKLKK